MRSHIHHTVSWVWSMVVIEVSKELELVSILMYIDEERVLSHMFPESSMVSLYFSIMFRSIWWILFMLDTKFFKEFCESLSKLTSTICSYSLDLVWYFMEDIPDKLHTCSHTLLRVYMRSHKPTTIIECVILYFWPTLSKWETDIYLYLLSRNLKTVSFESLSSDVLRISCIAYLVSLENSVYGRLIEYISCDALYSPWKLTGSHLGELTSQTTYLLLKRRAGFIPSIEPYRSITEYGWFWSWGNRNESGISIHPISTDPFRYRLSGYTKALGYFCNRSIFLKNISYCLYLHSYILVTLESWSHRWNK